MTIKRGFGRRWVGRAGRLCGGGLSGHPWVFEIRNEKNWHDVLVMSAASYGMEISIANFYPSDDEHRMLEEHSVLSTHPHHTSLEC